MNAGKIRRNIRRSIGSELLAIRSQLDSLIEEAARVVGEEAVGTLDEVRVMGIATGLLRNVTTRLYNTGSGLQEGDATPELVEAARVGGLYTRGQVNLVSGREVHEVNHATGIVELVEFLMGVPGVDCPSPVPLPDSMRLSVPAARVRASDPEQERFLAMAASSPDADVVEAAMALLDARAEKALDELDDVVTAAESLLKSAGGGQ